MDKKESRNFLKYQESIEMEEFLRNYYGFPKALIRKVKRLPHSELKELIPALRRAPIEAVVKDKELEKRVIFVKDGRNNVIPYINPQANYSYEHILPEQDLEECILSDGPVNLFGYDVISEMNVFDLDAFYHEKSASSEAVVLITPNQMIMLDDFENKGSDKNSETHEDTVLSVYKALYKDLDNMDSDEFKEGFEKWQDRITEGGNILIQLFSGMSSLVWLPDNVTSNQKFLLDEFNAMTKSVVSKDEDYFGEKPIVFNCNYLGEETTLVNDIEPLIDRVNDHKKRR